jgi:hypothetical protein
MFRREYVHECLHTSIYRLEELEWLSGRRAEDLDLVVVQNVDQGDEPPHLMQGC